jgi:hypothetical protein
MFPDLTNKMERELANLLALVNHHMYTDIFRYISEANIKFKEEFQKYYSNNTS